MLLNATSVDCPFKLNVCLGGKNSTISFDTGLLDSGLLGINSFNRPLFQRKAICAPLIVHGWYTPVKNPTSPITTITWNYGNDTTSDITYRQNRSVEFEAIFSPTGYEIKTRSMTSGQDSQKPYDNWTSNLTRF
jgi:hypothetical protein